MSQSSQPPSNSRSQLANSGLPHRSSGANKKKLQRRHVAMGRAIEALEPRRLLSVSGFFPAVDYNTLAGSRAAAAGDFNGDGKTDVVVTDQTANKVSVLINNGDGTFAAAVNYSVGSAPRAVVVGDFNGDGKLDLAVANQGGNNISVLLGNGNGTFQAAQSYGAGTGPVAIVAGNFGNGHTDLAVADSSGAVSVLLGNGNGTFQAAQSYSAGTGPDGIVAADFNGDGKVDLAVSDSGGGVSVLHGNGDGTFQTAQSYSAGATPKAIAKGDFNGDGYADLAVVNGTTGQVSILTNNQSGGFSAPSPLNVGTTPVAITAADFNNDGNTDLAVVNSGSDNVSILYGDGSGGFAAAINKSVGSNPQGITAGDFNGDGSIDLAVANQGDSNVSILMDKHITVTGDEQSTVEGQELNTVTVATFTDSESNTATTDYTANIDWGDGTTSVGAITENSGTFSVAGTHTYGNWGVYDVTVTVVDTLGTTASDTTTATISDASISSSGESLNATAGADWSGTVATFSNGDGSALLTDFTAIIDWGDGSSGYGTVVSDGNGDFHVTADHVWQQYGTPTVYVDIEDAGGSESIATTDVTVADAAITPSAASPVFTEGASSQQVVATFTDANPYAIAGQFTATIDWGDGNTTGGTVVADGNGFDVLGTHSYAHAGNETVGVTIDSAGGSSANVNSTAEVDNALLTLTATNDFSVTEGAATANDMVIASFTDANPLATANDFSAHLAWGDGTPQDDATINWNNATDQFDVSVPSHTYADAGGYWVELSISGNGGGSLLSEPFATVNNAAMGASVQSISATEGVDTGSILLATFTDANTSATAGAFTASVDWGDNSALDSNTTITGSNGNYNVFGDHLYQHAGPETFTVTVNGAGGGTASDSGTFTVSNAAITATAAPVEATEGSSFAGTVGSFTDANPFASASDFTATIDWGDGSPTDTGNITWDADSQSFVVTDTHTYDPAGSHTLSLEIDGKGGGSDTDTSSVTVDDAPLHSSGQDIQTTEGTLTGSVLIATFTDEDPQSVVGDYAVTVDWGDNSGADLNTSIIDNNGTFEVYGTHTYDHAGDHTIQTTIDDFGGSSTVATSTATVDNATVTPTPATFTATEGQSANSTVASFTDANAAADASDFMATIDWGDGNTSDGTITWNNGTSKFDITGTNTYLHAGDQLGHVTIYGAYGEVASTNFSSQIANDTITVTAQPIVGAMEGLAIDPTTVVGTFSDANAAAIAGDFTATVDWGDGSQVTTATIAPDNGQFDVIAGHTYVHAGPYTMTITVDGHGGGESSDTTSFTVANQAMAGSGNDFTITEGTATANNMVIASFTDANASASASDFGATIDWGDGSSTDNGTIAWNAGTHEFDVEAPAHTYADAGQDTVTVTIDGHGGGEVVVTPSATISNAAMSATAQQISAVEGVDTGSVLVATFTDANTLASASDFTASIDWGDGISGDTNTTIVQNGNAFDVFGDHIYYQAGPYSYTVSVNGNGGGTASDETTITVANAAMGSAGTTFDGVEGFEAAGTVATFTDADPFSWDGEFMATIDWGDGSPTSQGEVVSENLGEFSVFGTHTYQLFNNDPITVTIDGSGGGETIANSTADMSDAGLTSQGQIFHAIEGTDSGSVLVAHFNDANVYGVFGSYTATIDWGDGSSTTAGTIQPDGEGGYNVFGDHTFASAAFDVVSVVIGDGGTSTTTAHSVAEVAPGSIAFNSVSVSGTEGTAIPANTVVANFTDTDASAIAGGFSAIIDWGDGSPVAGGTVVSDGNGGFDVEAPTHTYLDPGSPPMVVYVTGYGDTEQSSPAVSIAIAAMNATADAISSTEGATFNGTVGSFTDANPLAGAGDFAASIDWGDGTSSSSGTIAWNNVSDQYDVSGSHVYDTPGDYTTTITIDGDDGGNATAQGSASVADAAITPAAASINATEGASFSGTVASFTDGDAAAPIGNYSATIDWGDGSALDTGTVVSLGNGQFDITGTHTWTSTGNKTVAVTINDTYGSSGNIDSTATVGAAALNVSGVNISATEGTAANNVLVATFTDGNPFVTAGEFSATIDWGDGTDTSNGTVQSDGHGGFDVYGSHTFNDAGSSLLDVTVNYTGGASSSGSSTASIANATLAFISKSESSTEGSNYNGPVAAFTDANTAASAGDFMALVQWGDGTTSSGSVAKDINNVFYVTASHTYAHLGNRQMEVIITGAGGTQISGDSSMAVGDASYVVAASAVSGTEGQAISNATVGAITDSNAMGAATNFTASINWGDGTTTNGTLVQTGPGTYNVQGSHTYLHAGNKSLTLTVHSDGGTSQSSSATATVGNAAMSAAAASAITVAEGTTFSGKVAHFTDANASASAADFTATINWGDGNTTTGAVTAAVGGGFDVSGSHAWSLAGAKSLTVTITGAGGGSAIASPSATVTAIAPKLAGASIRGTRGISLTATVATFTDANLLAAAGDFTAYINWGDGNTTLATVTRTSAGHFAISGTHTYASASVYSAKITLYGANATREVAASTLTIARPSASARHSIGGGNTSGSAHERHLHHLHHIAHASSKKN